MKLKIIFIAFIIILVLIIVIFSIISNYKDFIGISSIIKKIPVNNGKIISSKEVNFDRNTSTDRKGSIRIKANKSKIIKLYKLNNINIKNSILIYKADIKTKNLSGYVFLEMWCYFKDKGKFLSRGLNNTLSGTNEWTTLQTSFFLTEDDNPDSIELNLVINSLKGIIWIDNIRLVKKRLKK